MRIMALGVLAGLAGLTAGCATTTAYWDRPGARLPQLASESEGCYREAIAEESPSAMPAEGWPSGGRLLPRSAPPPALWKRAPRQAAFERYDEQVRYERCMRERGWTAVGSGVIGR
jgi:hypothetical protein